jgi:predicted RNase H-like nuclease (RuvC/YqgF family)
MDSDEYAEAQRNREIIESMQQRLEEMERINVDLEGRLEDQAKLCVDLEHECTDIERTWREKYDTTVKFPSQTLLTSNSLIYTGAWF